MTYQDIKLPTPAIFENKHPNSKVLIIGSGHSTKAIMDKQIRDKFDVIIACNYSFQYFDNVIDYHIVTEKTSKTSNNNVYKSLSSANFRINVPRIVNWKGIELYPKKYNLVKTTRSNFNFKCNPNKYKNEFGEGLLIGPLGKQKFSLGSVVLSALHFSCIIGAGEIYLVGADMCFKNEFDHFYSDRAYRDSVSKENNKHKIIQVELSGKTYDTTEFFKESAEYIDKMIETIFKDIKIYDFSDGLLKKPIKLNIGDI